MPHCPVATDRAPRRDRPAPSACAKLLVALAAAAAAGSAAPADTEAVTADGRRVVLKDDGTWRAAEPPAAAASAAEPPGPQARLELLGRSPRGTGCRYTLRLENRLPYAIGNVVPYFSAQRADGVDLDVASVAFIALRPGDSQDQVLDFPGVACDRIVRVLVSGGDRCEMGALNKFSDAKGACLARLDVAPSALVKFEK